MARLHQVAGRIGDLPPAVIDTALAVGIFAIGTIDALFSTDTVHPHTKQIPLLAMGAVGVALRRKNLWVAFALVQIAALASLVLDVPYMSGHGGYLEELVLVYTVAEQRDIRVSTMAMLLVFAIDFASNNQLRSDYGRLISEIFFLALVSQDLIWIGLAWFAGCAQRRRRLIARDLALSTAALNEEREHLARAAVASERARIVRDLQAVVIRGIEEMNLRTRTALAHLEHGDPGTTEAIVGVETKGRETLVQMRRLLTVLRGPSEVRQGDEADLRPTIGSLPRIPVSTSPMGDR